MSEENKFSLILSKLENMERVADLKLEACQAKCEATTSELRKDINGIGEMARKNTADIQELKGKPGVLALNSIKAILEKLFVPVIVALAVAIFMKFIK